MTEISPNYDSQKMTEFSFGRESSRKLFHLLILLFPFAFYELGRWEALTIIAPITLIVLAADYYRRKFPKLQFYFVKFFKLILREHEAKGDRFCGATWALLAATSIFLVCTEEIAITAFVILAISDTCAAMIGRTFPSKPFFEKSTYGSLAFYISGLIVLFACGGMFHSRLWFYLFGFFALFCATVIEARPSFFNVDDNFSVPISFAAIMSVFDLMWNYSY